MRILSVSDTAGVFVPIANWLVNNGHEAWIIMRKDFDPYGQTASSPFSTMTDSSNEFIFSVIQKICKFKPDLIHVNYVYEILPLVRLIALNTPIIFQYHGGDVRQRLAKGIGPHSQTKLADKIIVSTEDLQDYGEWYDRPIPDQFYYHGGRIKNTALMVYVNYVIIDQRPLAKELCKERGLRLTIINRDINGGVPYEDMPAYLSKFEFYLDFKGHTKQIILSKTALEALACGCKVIQDAALDTIITDPSPYVKNNHPRDYERLYRKIRHSPIATLRMIPCLIRYMLLSKIGLFHTKILIDYIQRVLKRI